MPVRPGTPGVWTDDIPSSLAFRTAEATRSRPLTNSSMVEEEDRPEALADVENVSVAPGMVRGTAQSKRGGTEGAGGAEGGWACSTVAGTAASTEQYWYSCRGGGGGGGC
jgi:hypothetical protein